MKSTPMDEGKRKRGIRKAPLAQAVAALGLALGSAVPMAGCSSDQAGQATEADATGSQAQESKASNPCAVKKKKGPCAVGG